MSSPSIALGDIGQIAIRVRNLATVTAFYREVLGLRHLFSAPPGLEFFAAGTVRLMLEALNNPNDATAGNSIIYYKVADIHAAHTTLQARGARMEGEPHLIAKMPDHDLWMTFLRDPENNLIGVMSEMRRT